MPAAQPRVTVIVPAYQSAGSLPTCIDSLLRQTIADIEIIVVDDGSTDSTPQVTARYSAADTRVITVRQSNQGVSSARNRALDMARGQWVAFVDSDDWVTPTYIESLLPSDTGTDLVIGGFTHHKGQASTVRVPSACGPIAIGQSHALIDKLDANGMLNTPWGKLFALPHIHRHGLRFDPRFQYGEDKLFVFGYLSHCSQIEVSSSHDYHYITVAQGLSARQHPMHDIWDWNEELLDTYARLAANSGMPSGTLHRISSRSYTYFTLYMANAIYKEPHTARERLSLIGKAYSRRRSAGLLAMSSCKGKTMKVAALLYRANMPLLTHLVYSVVCRGQGKGMIR